MVNHCWQICWFRFLVSFPSETGISLKNASWKQIREVILTDIAPPQLTLLSHSTISSWFTNEGFEIFSDVSEIPTSIWGKRTSIKKQPLSPKTALRK